MRYLSFAAALSLAGCSAMNSTVSPETGELRSTYQIQHPNGGTRYYELTRPSFTPPQYVSTSWNAAWQSLPGVYERLGMRGAVLNQDENLFGFRRARAFRTLGGTRMARLLRCGSELVGNASTMEVTLTVMTILEPSATGTSVRSWVDATARDQTGPGSTVQCSSTGLLEREIVRQLSGEAAPRS